MVPVLLMFLLQGAVGAGRSPSASALVSSLDRGGSNGSRSCFDLAARLDDEGSSGLWRRLDSALARARAPAVQVFANDAHLVLFVNFLCGLRRSRETRHLLSHVVAWVADASTVAYLEGAWPEVHLVDVSGVLGDDPSSGDAPFGTSEYAKFAAPERGPSSVFVREALRLKRRG